MIVFGFPAYFYYKASKLARKPISTFDTFACATYMLVATPLLTVLGTWASLRDIANDVRTHSNATGAFRCADQPW